MRARTMPPHAPLRSAYRVTEKWRRSATRRHNHPTMPEQSRRTPTARAVTPPHHPHIRTHRRGATALCHNPVRGAQRSVPGLDTPLLSACRRYATTPEPESDRTSGRAAADAPRAAERTKKSSSRGWRIQKYKCGLDYLTITLVAVPLARTT